MRLPLLMAALAAILLFLFNPDMEDFSVFAKEQSAVLMEDQLGGSALARMLAGAGSDLVGGAVARATERNNYFLFSTYTLDFDGDNREGNEWRFLGVAGMFFELDRPEVVKDLTPAR